MSRVVCFGEALIDMLPTEQGYQAMCGGAPANVAVAVSKLGGNSYFIGGLSQDLMGQKLKREMQEFGVNCDLAPEFPEKTALVLVSLDQQGERSFQFYRDNTADQQITNDSLKNIDWQRADIFHFCSNTLTDEKSAAATVYALERVKESNGIVSFDVNLRLTLWSETEDRSNIICMAIEEVLPFVDLVKLSTEELGFLSAKYGLTNKAYIDSLLSHDVSCVIVTDGPATIHWYTKKEGGEIVPSKSKSVDTTAAGDSFVGGLLFRLSQLNSRKQLVEHIEHAHKLYELIKFASKCGAHTVKIKGAFVALPRNCDV